VWWGAWPGGLGRKSPSGVQGQSPQKMKQNVKLVYKLYRFPGENLGFHDYRSMSLDSIFCEHTIKKNSEESMGGLNPLTSPMGAALSDTITGQKAKKENTTVIAMLFFYSCLFPLNRSTVTIKTKDNPKK